MPRGGCGKVRVPVWLSGYEEFPGWLLVAQTFQGGAGAGGVAADCRHLRQPWDCVKSLRSSKVTPVILHGVVSPDWVGAQFRPGVRAIPRLSDANSHRCKGNSKVFQGGGAPPPALGESGPLIAVHLPHSGRLSESTESSSMV